MSTNPQIPYHGEVDDSSTHKTQRARCGTHTNSNTTEYRLVFLRMTPHAQHGSSARTEEAEKPPRFTGGSIADGVRQCGAREQAEKVEAVVLPQKLFEDKVLRDNYEQRYELFFHTQRPDVSPVPACEDVGSVCFDKRCVLSIFAHSIGLLVCNSSASELTSICSPSPSFLVVFPTNLQAVYTGSWFLPIEQRQRTGVCFISC